MSHRWKLICWLPAALLAAGCSKSDPDTLVAIGRKLGDRSQLFSDTLEQTWANFSGRLVIETRVRTRLHWDKLLAETSIEVHATDTTVELKGTLTSSEQAKRAVELAETTLGVDKVVNSLQVEIP